MLAPWNLSTEEHNPMNESLENELNNIVGASDLNLTLREISKTLDELDKDVWAGTLPTIVNMEHFAKDMPTEILSQFVEDSNGPLDLVLEIGGNVKDVSERTGKLSGSYRVLVGRWKHATNACLSEIENREDKDA